MDPYCAARRAAKIKFDRADPAQLFFNRIRQQKKAYPPQIVMGSERSGASLRRETTTRGLTGSRSRQVDKRNRAFRKALREWAPFTMCGADREGVVDSRCGRPADAGYLAGNLPVGTSVAQALPEGGAAPGWRVARPRRHGDSILTEANPCMRQKNF